MKAFCKPYNSFTSVATWTIAVIFFLFIASCKKTEETAPVQETGTVTDIDNNTYRTVKIGNQWWMAEDLKVRRYRNGNYLSAIPSDSSGFNAWSGDTTGAYSDIRNNSNVIVGKYYNWYAVNNAAGLAPQGWHIPSDDEWKTLEKYLGMSQEDADKYAWRGYNEGDKLRIASSDQGWTKYGDVWSTNESGFTALAFGCRMFSGGQGTPGFYSTGFWWTSASHSDNESYYRYLDYKSSSVFRSHCSKNYGFCIRCVKD